MKLLLEILFRVYKFFQFLLVFQKPSEINIEIIDFFIKNDSYILASWNLLNTKRIKVLETNFESYSQNGSAYLRIPNHIEKITIKLNNNWSSKSLHFKIRNFEISDKINFSSKRNEEKFDEFEINVLKSLNKLNKNRYKGFDVQLRNLKPRIINKKFKI